MPHVPGHIAPLNQTPEEAKAAAARQAIVDRITIRAGSTPLPQNAPQQRPTRQAQAQQRLQQPLEFPDFQPGQQQPTNSVLVAGQEYDLKTGKQKFSTSPGVPVPTPERVPPPTDPTKARLVPEQTGPGVFLNPAQAGRNIKTGVQNLFRDPLGALDRAVNTIEEPIVRGLQLPFRAAGVDDLSALPNLPGPLSQPGGRGGLIGDIASGPARLFADPLVNLANRIPGNFGQRVPERFMPSQLARELSEGITRPRQTLNPLPLNDLERLHTERRDLNLSPVQEFGAGLPLELATLGAGTAARGLAKSPAALRAARRLDKPVEGLLPGVARAVPTRPPTPPVAPVADAVPTPTVSQPGEQAAEIVRRRAGVSTPGPRVRGPVELPTEPDFIRNAKPRYRDVVPEFESPVDKALYIVANRKTLSASDEKFMNYLREVFNENDAQIFSRAERVKRSVEATISKGDEFIEIIEDLPRGSSARIPEEAPDIMDMPVRGTKPLDEWAREVKAWEASRRLGQTADEGHQTLNQAAKAIGDKARKNARRTTQVVEEVTVDEVARAVAETKTDEVLDALHAGPNAGSGRVNKSNLINRVIEGIIQLGSEARLAMTVADWSAPLRQGGVLSASNPREWLGSWKAMAQATKDPAVARRIMDDIYDDDIVKNVFLSNDRGTKLEITEFGGFRLDPKTGKLRVEEGFEGELLRRIQGVGQVVDISERSFAVFLNRLRVDVAKKYYTTWLRQNKGRALDSKQIDELMEFINAATGRGNLPEWMQKNQKLWSATFFSPRYLISRVQLPYMLLRSSPAVRGLVARSLTAWAGMMFTTLSLFDMTPGVEVNWNPKHSDFGKITIGKMRFDILAGYAPLLRVFARVGSGETRGRGYTADVGRWDELKRFTRTKLSPIAGFAYDMITDEQFNGQEFMSEGTIFGKEVPGPVDALYENFTPLVFQEIVEAANEEGLFGAVAATPALVGAGVNTYSTVDDVALDVYGQPFEELWPYEQADVRETLRLSKDEISVYYSRVIAAEQTFKTDMEALAQRALTMEKRDVQEKYRVISDDLRDAKDAARLSAFGDNDNNIEFIAGGTPAESAALAEYYDIGKTVDSATEWNERFEELSKKWAQEGTLEYVQANTNMYDIPQAVWDKLSNGQRTRYRDSYHARIQRARDLPRRVDQIESAARSVPQEGAQPLPPVPPKAAGGRARTEPNQFNAELGKRALEKRIGIR